MTRTGPFWLIRTQDVNGVSGTGTVAEGIVFEGGHVALHWLTPLSSIAIYDSIEVVARLHGHGGRTRVRWEDGSYYQPARVSAHRKG